LRAVGEVVVHCVPKISDIEFSGCGDIFEEHPINIAEEFFVLETVLRTEFVEAERLGRTFEFSCVINLHIDTQTVNHIFVERDLYAIAAHFADAEGVDEDFIGCRAEIVVVLQVKFPMGDNELSAFFEILQCRSQYAGSGEAGEQRHIGFQENPFDMVVLFCTSQGFHDIGETEQVLFAEFDKGLHIGIIGQLGDGFVEFEVQDGVGGYSFWFAALSGKGTDYKYSD